MVDAVEAGFVAPEEGEGGFSGEFSEGCGGGVGDLVAGVCGDFVIEEAGLDGPGAAGGGDHLFDDVHFDIVGGLEAVDVLIEVELKILVVFILHDDGFGEESVAEGVVGGAFFALRGDRALGMTSIGAGGFLLFFGAHTSLPIPGYMAGFEADG